jgi:hypothetical protein
MATKDLIRRVAILKRNPQYAQLLPQQDFVALASDLLEAFKTLQKAVLDGRLKGEKGVDGRDGYSPIREVESAIGAFERRFSALASQVEEKLASVRDGKDGKDAEITEELKDELADMARALIELPDFETLIDQRIPENAAAIRDGLESLVGENRLSVEAIRGLQEQLEQLAQYAASNGGTIGKQQVFSFFRQFIPVSTTAPQAPKLNDLWVEI